MQEFDCPRPITLDLRIGAGAVDIFSEDRTTATVDISPLSGSTSKPDVEARVELSGDRLVIAAPDSPAAWLWRRCPRLRATVRVPTDSRLILKVASAAMRCRGRYASGQVNMASGDLAVEHVAGALAVNAVSGDVEIEHVDGDLDIRGASSQVRVGFVGGTAGIHSASGDIEVNHAGGAMRANTASGDITVHHAQRGQFRLKSASGDVSIGVASGTAVWLDLDAVSGTAHSALTMTGRPTDSTGADLSLHVRTMSGNISVYRASGVQLDKPAA